MKILSGLLTKDRIQKLTTVACWRTGIRVAAQPLVDDDSITEDYIVEMIAAVDKFGPYIVLIDNFALPHAQGTGSVKRMAMSLLVTEEKIDMRGVPVTMFMVLAPTDKESHVQALKELSDILEEEKNLAIVATGDSDKILDLIKGKE
ncbi:MAG: PTS sugar transporter subunit IIA [Defluviitaleaceae bacterium]|nr:PTS sugar transporter subunit IIA [Defluviitaleaceae bacterium]